MDYKVYLPDGGNAEAKLKRTTVLCVAAHQDDIEIMAYAPISECIKTDGMYFTGAVVTDGAGSPRSGAYADMSDAEMAAERINEQCEAAKLGSYNAMVFFGATSAEAKGENTALTEDIGDLIKRTNPDTLYTHNLADKHPTHVAVALKVVEAVRRLPDEQRPRRVISLEAWRGLDWLPDSDKLLLDTSADEQLAARLINAHKTQVAGGKSYDAAAVGRRRANATFLSSHEVDGSPSVTYALDITRLCRDPLLSPRAFIAEYIDRFRDEVLELLPE